MAANKFILPAIGTAVVVAGGAAAFFYFKGAPGGLADPLASARLVPDEALMAAFITTDDQTWSKLDKFGTPEAQKVLKDGIKEFQQKMLTETQIDYDKDVKPWVGNVMVAVLPSEKTAKKQEPNVLMVVGIKDKANALSFANKLSGQAKVKATETDYKGVKITDFASEKNSTYSAVLKDYLVVSADRQTIEKAIDTSKGEPSLVSKPEAESILTKGVDVQNPIARFYMLDYAATMQQMMQSSGGSAKLSPASVEQLKQVKSVVAGLGIDDSGLRLKATANLDPNAKTIAFKPVSGSIVSQFPNDTFALMSGGNISGIWSQFVEQAKTTPENEKTLNQMRVVTQSVAGLNLDKEVFGWMDGEFGVGFIPVNQGVFAQAGFGGAFIFDTSDRKTAEAALSKLDNLAKSNLPIAKRDVQGKQVTEWTIPGQGAILGHGWLDQDTVFLAVGGPLVDAIANKPSQALANNANFTAITGSLPKNNVGFFYIDMEKTMELMNRTVFANPESSVPPETMAILNSIKGMGMTSAQPDKTKGEVEMVLALKPATK